MPGIFGHKSGDADNRRLKWKAIDTDPVTGEVVWAPILALEPTSIAGGGGAVALDAPTLAALETISVANFPAVQPVSDNAGSLTVDGVFWQATQPVSGPLTDAQLRAVAVPVSGTFWQATQPVSKSGNWPIDTAAKGVTAAGSPTSEATSVDVQSLHSRITNASLAVTGTFWQATQPISAASLPLPTGASTAAGQSTVKAASTLAVAADTSQVVQESPHTPRASITATATGAVNTAVTLTLAAPGAGLFHYITSIQVMKLYSVIGVAAGAGVIITTTNLTGAIAWTTEQLAKAAGTVERVVDLVPAAPIKSAVANTATTIVAPIQLQTIWRINVTYYTAP